MTLIEYFVQPPVQRYIEPCRMNQTSRIWYDVVFTETRSDHLGNSGGGWVDVRDVGLGHVCALQKREASGQRILLVSSGMPHPSLASFSC